MEHKVVLTPVQIGILVGSLDTSPPLYISQAKLELRECFCIDTFWQAWETLVQRHELLRAHIDLDDDDAPCFVIHEKISLKKQTVDLTTLNDLTQQQEINAFLSRDIGTPFDLTSPSLFRLCLFQLAEDHFILICTYHHILMCASAGVIALKEVFEIVGILMGKRSDPLLPSHSVKEYIRSNFSKEIDYGYWRQLFSDFSGEIATIIEPEKSEKLTSSERKRYRVNLSSSLRDDLKHCAKQNGVTPYILFQAAWSLLLSRYTDSNDITLGVVRALPNNQMQGHLNLFINTLPLRVTLSKDCSVIQLLQTIKRQNAAFKNRVLDNPSEISNDVKGVSALFQTVIEYKPITPEAILKQDSTDWNHRKLTFLTNTHYALFLEIFSKDDTITVILAYDPHQFSEGFVKCLLQHWQNLLEAICNPKHLNHSAVNLSMLTSSEFEKIKDVSVRKIVRQPLNLMALLEKQFSSFTNSTAIYCKDHALTYAQLKENVAHFSSALKDSLPSSKIKFIGIHCDRSVALVIAILSIWKIGCAYVPIDAKLPKKRMEDIINDAELRVVISQNKFKSYFDELVSCVSIDAYPLKSAPSNFPPVMNHDTDALAYLMYTSGTTGKPKGVLVKHASLSNILIDVLSRIKFSEKDVFFAVSSLSFDISILELIGPLLLGGKVFICSEEARDNVDILVEQIQTILPTVIQATPTLLKAMLACGWKPSHGLKILSGGEPLPTALAKQLIQLKTDVWNLYGPTETTVWSAIFQVSADIDALFVPVGKPLANTDLIVCDQFGNLVPLGRVGELYIGGMGVSRYWKNEPVFAQKFARLTLCDHEEYFFKTNDLAKWSMTGDLELLGRRDRQIKWYGHRIELSDIEVNLLRDPVVADAVVIEKYSQGVIEGLSAYILPEAGFLKNTLPHISLFFFPSTAISEEPYELLFKAAKFADQQGFLALWVPERHFNDVGAPFPNPSVIAASLSVITKNIQIRAGSVVAPLHHPVRIAEEWAMVDHLSKGRVGISFASGWQVDDFSLAPDCYENRKNITYEIIDIFRRLWAGKLITMKNGADHTVELSLFPRPYSKEIPLWLTASGSLDTFRNAGKLGLNLLTHLLAQSLSELTTNIQIYQEALRENGFDPNEHTITLMVHTFVGQTNQEALNKCKAPLIAYLRGHLDLVKPLLENHKVDFDSLSTDDITELVEYAYHRFASLSLIGDMATCKARLEGFKEIGISEVASLIDFGLSEGDILSSLKLLSQIQEQGSPHALTKRIRNHLADKVPFYMLPTSIQICQNIPRTIQGKVDYSALEKTIAQTTSDTLLDQPEMVSPYFKMDPIPSTDIRDRLRFIWQEILNVSQVRTADKFFELGGRSIHIIMLRQKIEAEFGITLTIKEILKLSTLEVQGQMITRLIKDLPIRSASVVEEKQLENFPMTSVQMAYYFGRRADYALGGIGTHHYFEWKIDDLDLEKLERCLNVLISHHAMLRAVVVDVGTMRILPEVKRYHIVVHDFSALSPSVLDTQLVELRDTLSHTIYDPHSWPLFTVQISKSATYWRLHFSVDALILDGYSIYLLLQDWLSLYNDNFFSLPTQGYSFAQYATKLSQQKSTAAFKQAENFWKLKLNRIPAAPTLAQQAPLHTIQDRHFCRVKKILSEDHWVRLDAHCDQHGLSANAVFLSVLSELMNRWGENREFTLNITLFNRVPYHEEVKHLVGDFTTTALLVTTKELLNIPDIFDRAKWLQEEIWRLLEYSIFDGVEVQRLLNIHKSIDSDTGVVFPIVFTSLVGMGDFEPNMPKGSNDLFSKEEYSITQSSQVLLDCKFYLRDRALHIEWDYVKAAYPKGLIEDLIEGFTQTILSLIQGQSTFHDQVIPQWQIDLLDTINMTQGSVCEATLPDLIYQQVNMVSNKLALVSASQRMTYQELWYKAGHLAQVLVERSHCRPSIIAIYLPKGPDQVVAALAVNLVGAAFVPIDTCWPLVRVTEIFAECKIRMVISNKISGEEAVFSNEIDCIDVHASPNDQPSKHLSENLKPNSIAYILFTSGSTGKPKGIEITHRSVINTILDINHRFSVTAKDIVFNLSRFTFDLSMYDFFGLLAAGGTVVFDTHENFRNPSSWYQMLSQYNVTIWNSVPAQLMMLIEFVKFRQLAPLPCLRRMLISGDKIPSSLPRKAEEQIAPNGQFVALGGATEASIWSCYYTEQDKHHSHYLPYGRPLTNQIFYVFNEQLQRCPFYVPGVIFIGGIGVANGYWNNPEQNKKSFIVHPVTGERLFRTGDIGYYLENGMINLVGREDNQVKLNGIRIELDEIDHCLLLNSKIQQVRTVLIEGANKEESALVSYMVPMGYQAITQGDQQYLISANEIKINTMRESSFQHPVVIQPSYPLAPHSYTTEEFLKRKSCRDFNFSSVSIKQVQEALNDAYLALKQTRDFLNRNHSEWLTLILGLLSHTQIGQEFKRMYPSAHGLYAVQLYVIFSEKTEVNGEFLKGYYYYCPIKHELLFDKKLTETGPQINNGFKLCFFVKKQTIYPVYGELSRKLCLIEVGHILALLNAHGYSFEYMPSSFLNVPFGSDLLNPDDFSLCEALPVDKGENVDLGIGKLKIFIFIKNESGYHSSGALFEYDRHSQTVKHIKNSGSLENIFNLYETMVYSEASMFILFFSESSPNPSMTDQLYVIAGRLVQHLQSMAQQSSLAFCPIGRMNAKLFLEAVGLEDLDYLYGLVGGYPANNQNVPDLIRFNEFSRAYFRQYLNEKLPEHSIPSAYVLLSHFPLTPNGKIDLNYLAQIKDVSPSSIETHRVERPTNADPIETTLVSIWKKYLMLERIDIDANFFSLGGSSLILYRIVAIIENQFNAQLGLEQFLKSPTIEMMATMIRSAIKKEPINFRYEPFQLLSTKEKTALQHVTAEDIYPLTAMQEMMVFQQITSQASARNLYLNKLGVIVERPFLFELFNQGFMELLNENPILKTYITFSIHGRPYQAISTELPEPLLFLKSNFKDKNQQERYVRRLLKSNRCIFEITKPPLFKIIVVQFPTSFAIILVTHHLIFDAWSTKNLIQHILSFYLDRQLTSTRKMDDAFPLFILKQAEILHRLQHNEINAIKEMYATFDTSNRFIFLKQHDMGCAQKRQTVLLKDTWRMLALAKTMHVPVSAVLLAAHARVLAKLYQSTDVITGLIMNCRDAGSEHSIGLYLNIIPLRVRLEESATYYLVKQVHEMMSAVKKYQDIDFLSLSKSHAIPSIDTTFNYLDYSIIDNDLEAAISYLENRQNETNMLLNVTFERGAQSDHLLLKLLYDERILSLLPCPDPLARIYEIELQTLCDQFESQRMELHEGTKIFPEPQWEVGTTRDIHFSCLNLLESALCRYAADPALKYRNTVMSYAELDTLSTKLSKSITGAKRVGVFVNRGPALIISILACIKSHVVFLPLDVHAPEQRVKRLLTDAGIDKLIVDKQNSSILELFNVDSTEIEMDLTIAHVCFSREWQEGQFSEGLLYMLFTSGSTGKPKGVLSTDMGACNHILWLKNNFALQKNDVVYFKTPICFDAALSELFLTFVSGACLLMSEEGKGHDVDYLLDTIIDNHVSFIQMVPSLLRRFLLSPKFSLAKSLHTIISAGEVLDKSSVKTCFSLLPTVKLFNLYGLTEASIDSCYWQCEPVFDYDTVPIGRPITNTTVRILTSAGNLTQINEYGELWIGGHGISPGYLLDGKFHTGIEHVKINGREEPLLKTGDIAKWNSQGLIEIAGRTDDMIKRLGNRVGLNEINEMLLSQNAIVEAKTIVIMHNAIEKIISFVVSDSSGLTKIKLYQWLKRNLPYYMLPDDIIFVKEFPMLPSHKIDIQALSESWKNAYTSEMEQLYAEQSIERRVSQLVKRILNDEDISFEDNLYQHNFSSLNAFSLLAELNQAFNLQFGLSDLMHHCSISGLVNLINVSKHDDSAKDIFWFKNGNDAYPPLIFVPPISGDLAVYEELVNKLTYPGSIVGVKIPMYLTIDPKLTLQSIAKGCVQSLIKRFSHKRLRLLGWSFGALLAYEMAFQLHRDYVITIDLLAMIDIGAYPEKDMNTQTIFLKNIIKFNHFVKSLESTLGVTLVKEDSMHEGSIEVTELVQWYSLIEAYCNTEKRLHLLPLMRSVINHGIATIDYQCQYDPSSAVIISAATTIKETSDFIEKWRRVCNNAMAPYTINGDHYSLMNEDASIDQLAQIVKLEILKIKPGD